MSKENETDKAGKNKHPQRKGRKKYILVAFLAALLMAVGVFTYEVKSLTGTANGVITHKSEAITSNVKSLNFTPVAVKGALVSFSYPQFMSVYTAAQKPVSPILGLYEYSYHDIQTWLLTITITKLSANSLSADSAYRADQLNPSVYIQSTVVDKGKTYTIMTNQQATGFNKIAFSLNNGMSAEISLIGDDSLGVSNLQKTLNEVIGSFTWN